MNKLFTQLKQCYDFDKQEALYPGEFGSHLVLVKAGAGTQQRLAEWLQRPEEVKRRQSIMHRVPNNRIVTAKVWLDIANNADAYAAWVNEREMMLRIRYHANIANYLASFSFGNMGVLLLEAVGVDLENMKIMPMQPTEMLHVFRQIGAGLVHLHSQLGIAHGRLQVANMVIGPSGHIKLTNFTHARRVSRKHRTQAAQQGGVHRFVYETARKIILPEQVEPLGPDTNLMLRDGQEFALSLLRMINSSSKIFNNLLPKEEQIFIRNFQTAIAHMAHPVVTLRVPFASAYNFMHRFFVEARVGRLRFTTRMGVKQIPQPFMSAPGAPPALLSNENVQSLKTLLIAHYHFQVGKFSNDLRFIEARPTEKTFAQFVSDKKIKAWRQAKVVKHSQLHARRVCIHLNVARDQPEFGRFYRMSARLANNRHSNILTEYFAFWHVFDAKTGGGGGAGGQAAKSPEGGHKFPVFFFSVMEHHGASLLDMKNFTTLTFGNAELCVLIKRIGSALIYLHQRGWAHRAVSEANIVTLSPIRQELSSAEFCTHQLKLIDFSSAIKIDDRNQAIYRASNRYSRQKLAHLSTGGAFMSAERARKNPYLKDSYYFGKMLKELACRRPAGSGDTSKQSHKQLNDQFMALPLNDVLKWVIDRMASPFSVTVKAAYDVVKRKAGFENFYVIN